MQTQVLVCLCLESSGNKTILEIAFRPRGRGQEVSQIKQVLNDSINRVSKPTEKP